MKKITPVLLIVCFTAIAVNAQQTENKFIPSNSKRISYMGRVDITDSCTEIYWTGTSATIKVKNTVTVKVIMDDEKDNDYYYVIIDGDGSHATKIKINQARQSYTLASGLSKTMHTIELFKVTNTDFITARLFGFEIDKTASILKPDKKPKRKIEFFGNSITCGHGAENDSHDSGAPEFFNNYRAYGAITARHFGAQYHCTSKSGIGIAISWFSEVMPDIYDRLNPEDSTSVWDFRKYIPDIVVVNLFQNDSWLVNMPEHQQFKARFGAVKPTEGFIITAYKNFIQSLRSKYPDAHIICALGNMDATREGSKWPGYIDSAAAQLGDNKIVTHFFPYKGTPGHPVIKDHEVMAADLIAFIEKQGYWK